MQAAIDTRVPHVRDGLIVANVGGVSKVTEAKIRHWGGL
jgi:hypothetical protein